MTFTFPAFLWALPLAAAPLLLHLLSRRQARRTRFSDLSFLRRVYARALPRTRLQQWLLVAARCFLLLLLILAYAGPVLQARGDAASGSGGDALDLAVLVDESYSMGYREAGKTRLELARAQLESLLRTLRASDRVALIPFSDRLEISPQELAWGTPRQALDRLPRLSTGFRPTDLAPALKAAAELFARADSKSRRAVLLLGDGARHGARGALPALEPGVAFLGLEWPAGASNSYLAWAGPSRDSDARKPQLLVKAAGLTGPTTVELSEDGRRLEGAALRGPGEQTALLPLPGVAAGGQAEWAGQAALRPDALAADDAYYFAFRHPARARLLCLYGDPSFFKAPNAGYFLKQLVGGEKDSLLPFEADYLDFARFQEAKLSDYKLVLLADVSQIPAGAAAELDRFVRRGGGLFVAPGSLAGGEALAPLAALLPAQLGPIVEGEGGGLRPGPAADARAWKGFELDKIALTRYHLLQLRAGSQALFRSASGYPLLAVGRRGDGRTALWAATLDATWTNLPLKPAFAPLLQAVLDAVSPPGERLSQTRDLKIGQPLRRVWEENEAAPASVRLRGPDGKSQTVWLRGRAVEFSGTDRPGLYTMTEEGSGRRTQYAVNLDRSTGESDLAPLPAPPWTPLRADDLALQFRLKVYGRDARAGALAAAASLLILEMLLALPRRAAAALILLLLAGAPARAQHGDRFVWTQLKLGDVTDPYPTAWAEALNQFGTVTSVLNDPERRLIAPSDPELYFSPLVILAGRQAPPELGEEDVRRLRNYLTAGGLLWIEDTSGTSESAFDRWVRRTLPRILPESDLAQLPADHVVYRTFFLLRGPAGRAAVRGSLEGVSWAGRTAVLYSRNDLLGVWPKDALGQPLYPCLPGGEPQRHNARKLTLNILMFALTGSYKADAVHQPYLLQKMRSGVP
jgi:hypothetical protein